MTSDRRDEERSGQTDADFDAGELDEAESEGAGREGDAGAEGFPGDGPREDSELQQMRERYLRLAAEFDNYRKRTERERSEHSVRAQGRLVQGMLDAIDDLERVADYTAETTTVEALLEGVQMVERKLLRALESAGLELLDARGERFDPEVHEALMTAGTEHEHEDETVGEVFQKGYRFQGHLLRPARVQVRKHSG